MFCSALFSIDDRSLSSLPFGLDLWRGDAQFDLDADTFYTSQLTSFECRPVFFQYGPRHF